MSNATDMSTPVTRAELQEDLTRFATKVELELWGGALLARIESGERRLIEQIAQTERQLTERLTRTELQLIERIAQTEMQLTERITQTEQRLQADLARHAGALYESMATLISTIDDKYADLPGRVSRLETVTFGGGRR
jgi:hypothetical protein